VGTIFLAEFPQRNQWFARKRTDCMRRPRAEGFGQKLLMSTQATLHRLEAMAMKLITEARVESEDAELLREPIRLAVAGRDDGDLKHLGKGRALMAAAHSALLSNQATQWLATQDYCRRGFTPLRPRRSSV
jgi:hypothetical protein